MKFNRIVKESDIGMYPIVLFFFFFLISVNTVNVLRNL